MFYIFGSQKVTWFLWGSPHLYPCCWVLFEIWILRLWGSPQHTLLPRSPQKSNNSFLRDTSYSATHTSFSFLHPVSFHLALHSLCCSYFLLHFIFLFRMCTLGSDSRLGLCHCWGVCVGGFHWVWGGLVRPVGSSYSRQPPSRPDPRTIGIKLLLFFPPNRRDDKDGIPLGLLTPGCTAEVTVGGG